MAETSFFNERPSSFGCLLRVVDYEVLKKQIGSVDLVVVDSKGSVVTGERKIASKGWLHCECVFSRCNTVDSGMSVSQVIGGMVLIGGRQLKKAASMPCFGRAIDWETS